MPREVYEQDLLVSGVEVDSNVRLASTKFWNKVIVEAIKEVTSSEMGFIKLILETRH